MQMAGPTTWPSTVTAVGTCPSSARGLRVQPPRGPAQPSLLLPARVRLYVDDELQDTTAGARPSRRQRRQDARMLFQLGGSPEPGALSNLTGCIANVFVKR